MQKQKKNFIYKEKAKLHAKYVNLVNLSLVNKFLVNRFVSSRNKHFLPRLNLKKRQFFFTNPLKKQLLASSYYRSGPLNFIKKEFVGTMRVRPNNIFFTLKSVQPQQMLLFKSAGSYKLNVSKKTLKYNSIIFLKLLLKDIKKQLGSSFLKQRTIFRVKLSAPFHLRASIFLFFLKAFRRASSFQVAILEKKAFNGCRPKKKKRKKRQGLRIFK
jgi:hypothetical protein